MKYLVQYNLKSKIQLQKVRLKKVAMSSLPDQEIWKPKKMTDQSFLNQKLRRQWLSRSKLHPRVPNYCISFVTSTKSVTRLFLKVLTVKEMQECVHFSPWDSSKILCAWCEQGLIHSMLTYFNVDGGLLRRDATFEDYREKKSQFFFCCFQIHSLQVKLNLSDSVIVWSWI